MNDQPASTAIGPLDIKRVMAALPHRYPMLLVDRVESLVVFRHCQQVFDKGWALRRSFAGELLVLLDREHHRDRLAVLGHGLRHAVAGGLDDRAETVLRVL